MSTLTNKLDCLEASKDDKKVHKYSTNEEFFYESRDSGRQGKAIQNNIFWQGGILTRNFSERHALTASQEITSYYSNEYELCVCPVKGLIYNCKITYLVKRVILEEKGKNFRTWRD